MAKKPKKPESDAISQETAAEICNASGLEPEQIAWLLDSLHKLGAEKTVTRQLSGQVLHGPKKTMPIAEAVELELKRAQERREREEIIKANRFIKSEPAEPVAFSSEGNDYPKLASPVDIGRALDAARAKLAQKAGKNMPQAERIRAEMVLQIIDRIKSFEVVRVAKRIAQRQKKSVQDKKTEELKNGKQNGMETKSIEDRLEEERQKAARSLEGFGTKGLHTLLDEAAEVVQTDYDASAKVLNQWIGTSQSQEGI